MTHIPDIPKGFRWSCGVTLIIVKHWFFVTPAHELPSKCDQSPCSALQGSGSEFYVGSWYRR